MKGRLLIVFSIMLLPAASQADRDGESGNSGTHPQVKKIKEYCAREWPNDYDQQEYCVNQQTEGYNAIVAIKQKHGGEITGVDKKILSRCANKWSLDGMDGFDWDQMKYCYEQQRESYDRLN